MSITPTLSTPAPAAESIDTYRTELERTGMVGRVIGETSVELRNGLTHTVHGQTFALIVNGRLRERQKTEDALRLFAAKVSELQGRLDTPAAVTVNDLLGLLLVAAALLEHHGEASRIIGQIRAAVAAYEVQHPLSDD